MVGWISKRRCSPIGVDIGSRSVKLLQLSADYSRVWETARWELPAEAAGSEQRDKLVAEAIRQAREGRNFRGRDAVFCLGAEDLFVQNIRVPQASGDDLKKSVHFEAVGRLPFNCEEAEVRFFDAADVRQGDTVRREVILLACRRPTLSRIVAIAQEVGLQPVAIDVEPSALLRSYSPQFRRDEDHQRRVMFVHVGASNTVVVIARGPTALFIKYVDIGGRHLDEAVARRLQMDLADATALRRHNGDRRADQRDPEISRGIAESIRPVLERLANEVSLCIRYHSVTFRGQPLSRVVVSGGEATAALTEWLAARLDVECELGDPLRTYEKTTPPGRSGQWDVVAGLALREAN